MFLNGVFQWVMANNCFWLALVSFMVGSSVVVSGAQAWFVAAPRGRWLWSASFPDGNQVDGLPPAPS